MKKNSKNILIIIITVITIAAVGGSTVKNAAAYGQLISIQNIVSDYSNLKKDYRILEIVPTEGLGEIGYFSSEQEYNYVAPLMEKYLQAASGQSGRLLRTKTANDILDSLQQASICTADVNDLSYPVYSSGYDEEYFLTDSTVNYHSLDLPAGTNENISRLKGYFQQNHNGNCKLFTTDDNTIIPASADVVSEEPEYFIQNTSGGYLVTFQQGTSNAKLRFGAYQYDSSKQEYVKTQITDAATAEDYWYVTNYVPASNESVENVTSKLCSAAYYSYSDDGDYSFVETSDGIEYRFLRYGSFALTETGAEGSGTYSMKTTDATTPLVPETDDVASVNPESFVQNNAGGYAVTFTKGTTGTSVKTNYGTYSYDSENKLYTKVDSPVETEKENYYYVSDVSIVQNGKENTYPISSADNSMVVTVRCCANYYQYDAEKGNYEFKLESGSTGSAYRILVNKVYYTFGFVNRNWLSKKVFGTESEDFNVKVDTMTPQQVNVLTSDDLTNYQMVYLCGNNIKSGIFENITYNNPTGASDYSYDQNQDINLSIMSLFLDKMISSRTPCIIDHSVIQDAVIEGVTAQAYNNQYSNIYKLSAFLLQDDMGQVYEGSFSTSDVSAYYTNLNWPSIFTNVETKSLSCNDNFVNQNVYCCQKVDDNTDFNHRLISNAFGQALSSDAVTKGFAPVKAMIQLENQIRSGNDVLPADISQATIIQYIINYITPTSIENKKEINVLEIQPNASLYVNNDLNNEINNDLKLQDVKNFSDFLNGAEYDSSKIHITTMSSSEFIGKIDDINTEYDIVYIGANLSGFNLSSGATDYNDKNMDGLIYTHTGDSVTSQAKLGGILDTETKKDSYGNEVMASTGGFQFRFSGNDITEEKLNNLKSFVNAKYALIVDSALISGEKGSRTVDQQHVDNSSNMYQFLDYCKDMDNVAIANVTRDSNGSADHVTSTDKIAVNLVQQDGYYNYINMPKPELTVAKDDSNNDKITTIRNGSNTTISWDVIIKNGAVVSNDTEYNIGLYFDLNADGKFSKTTEKVNDNITLYKVDGTNLIYQNSNNGNYSITEGEYKISCIISSKAYVGEIPWKLMINQVKPLNGDIRDSVNGYYKVKTDQDLKEDINILQIKQNSKYCNNYDDYRVNNWDMANDPVLTSLIKDSAVSDDYNINITSMMSDVFVNKFNESAIKGKNYIDENNYNMIILGFADVYIDMKNNVVDGNQLGIGPVTAIENYIEDGKSVLFTHDTTSFINVDETIYNNTGTGAGEVFNNTAFWGYNINTFMRNIVGMDRYGVTGVNGKDYFSGSNTNEENESLLFNNTAKILRKGSELDVQLSADGKSVSTYTDAKLNPVAKDTENSMQQTLDSHDFAYEAKSNDQKTYGETQGYSNLLLDSLRTKGYYSVKTGSGIANYGNGNGAFSNMYASKINEGLITSYPYQIEDTLSISDTHLQYYQLDLEDDSDHDGESDIVVWYTIGGITGNTSNPYYATKNDVRNNYYIYSKRNVTYSGIGHSEVTSDDEKKLFVNTLIAAFRNGVQPPAVSVLSGPSLDSSEIYSKYVTYDAGMSDNTTEGASQGKLDSNTEFYYSVYDPNLAASNRTMSVKYYVADDKDGAINTVDVSGLKNIKLKEITTASTQDPLNGEAAVSSLLSGHSYHTVITNPYDLLGDKSTADIYVVVSSSFDYYGKRIENEMGYSKLTLVKAQLFNMD